MAVVVILFSFNAIGPALFVPKNNNNNNNSKIHNLFIQYPNNTYFNALESS
jgi:hypothetical protein